MKKMFFLLFFLGSAGCSTYIETISYAPLKTTCGKDTLLYVYSDNTQAVKTGYLPVRGLRFQSHDIVPHKNDILVYEHLSNQRDTLIRQISRGGINRYDFITVYAQTKEGLVRREVEIEVLKSKVLAHIYQWGEKIKTYEILKP